MIPQKVLCPFCWQEMDVDYPVSGFGPWHTCCEDENPWGWDLRWLA